MGLFSNSDSDVLKKYNLENLPPQDLEIVYQIAKDLAGNKLVTVGNRLSGNPVETAKLTYMSALVQQNWIIINQLSRLSSLLEKQSDPEPSNTAHSVAISTDAQIPLPVQISEAEATNITVAAAKQYLSAQRVMYIDNTASGGMLWIAFDNNISDWIEGITINGNKPKHIHSAGILGGKPGWFVSA